MTEPRSPADARLPAPAGRQGEPAFPPGRRRPGRPVLLTPAVEEKYFAARRLGNSRADSARYAGLAPITVEKWIRRARGMEPKRPARPEYVRFLRMDEEAKAAVKVFVVGNIVARSRQDHNAGLAWLRVHGGEEWSDRLNPDDPGGAGTGVTVDQRDSTFIVLPREAVPDLVHQLLETRRREMAAIEPINVTPAPGLPRRNGNSRAAREGLRVDSEADD